MLSFDNTEIAFKSKSDWDLDRACLLFKLIGSKPLVKIGKILTNLAIQLHFPIEGLVKATIFKQFCGGADIAACKKTIDQLAAYNIGAILNYSAEGNATEEDFEKTLNELMKTVETAAGNPAIPFCVFKITGIARFKLLEKITANQHLTEIEKDEYDRVKLRVQEICGKAHELNVRLLVDAEESWIQDAIDEMVNNMMLAYNKEKPTVYNTIQMYRWDRLAFLKQCLAQAEKEEYFLGIKLVRGAYMEIERERARVKGYESPIQETKEKTDQDFNTALKIFVENVDRIGLCAGTHNEESSKYLAELMAQHNIAKDNPAIYFSQLYGMSDQISFILANEGYNIAKFMPYGPVKEVIPYLIRRAEENTSITAELGRELSLVLQEKRRRKNSKINH